MSDDEKLALHLSVVQHAMNLADILRQIPIEDEDLKVIQMLGMRMFNAFGASTKLALSGYIQNSALVMRDILKTVFVVNLFNHDRGAIERWRLADDKERRDNFSPINVRKALDERDGFEDKQRAELYKMFSELAGHPNMKSVLMMRPEKGDDAVIGPFMEPLALETVLSELGKIAIQVGEQLNAFFPPGMANGRDEREAFAAAKVQWVKTFNPKRFAALITRANPNS